MAIGRKRTLVAAVCLAMIVAVLLVGPPVAKAIARKAREARWIGRYPPLKQVERGMDKTSVLQILGQPTTIKVNEAMSEGFLGQGKSGARIEEAWIFQPPGWYGSIEVYFGADGRVIAMNWGYC